MEETLVLVDAAFLSKLSKHLGKGKYINYSIIDFFKKLSKKQNLFCKHIFYYTAPPFQSENPSNQESERYKKYRRFVKKLSKDPVIAIREGRCQRLKIDDNFVYKQKGVDSLMIMDMMKIPIDYKNIKKIVLIASDSDFVPIIKYLSKLTIETILYTHYSKNRESNLSKSNELLKIVNKYVEITKKDFENAPLKKEVKDEK
ncbi:hypothetical protein CMI42_05055 [Candidatus Pacearchaeota archaeon]|nr:hypothetical protein [Candidatus Pacearchaeota archaeon]